MNEDAHLICCNRDLEEISGHSTVELAGMHPPFFAGSEKEMISKKYREVLECCKIALEAYLLAKTGDMIPHSHEMEMDSNG